jgi:hypothetical protein
MSASTGYDKLGLVARVVARQEIRAVPDAVKIARRIEIKPELRVQPGL